MNITDIITRIDDLDDEAVIYARKHAGKFTATSEVILLNLSEEEQESDTADISAKYCPGFDYFLEAVLVKDLIYAIAALPKYKSVERQVERVLSYAESAGNAALD